MRSAYLDLPLVLNRDDRASLHQQLASALRDAASRGLIAPGSKLPSTRLLAAQLHLARSTVIAAYQQLDGEGYVQSRHGSGTYLIADPVAAQPVSSPMPSAAARDGCAASDDREVIDLRPGRPDTRRLADPGWRRAWRSAVVDPPPDTEPPLQGLPLLRAEVARHLAAARGLPVDEAAVFVTAGTNDGLALLVHALQLHGHDIAVENPGYPEAWRLLTRLGCRTVPVPVDDGGVIVDRLPAGSSAPRAALVTPSHQYPLGGRLPVARRIALLDWANRHEATVIEDDYDSEFRFDVAPLPALASLDRSGRVVHIGTFGKALSPWLRIGYLVAPAHLIPDLIATRADLGTPVSGVVQQALGNYLASGALRRHIARSRRDYSHARAHLTRRLARDVPEALIRGIDAGLHTVLEFPPDVDADRIVRCAREAGVLLDALANYTAPTPDATPGPPAIVLGYGGAALEHLDRAVHAIRSAVHCPDRPPRSPLYLGSS